MKRISLTKIDGTAHTTPQCLSNILAGRRRPSWRLAKRLEGATGIRAVAWIEGKVSRQSLKENHELIETAICARPGIYPPVAAKQKKRKTNGFEEFCGGCGTYRQIRLANAVSPVRFDRQKIVEIRKEHGLCRAAFSRLIERPEPTVRDWEAGHADPAIKDIESICNVFATDPDYFFQSVKNGPPHTNFNPQTAQGDAR